MPLKAHALEPLILAAVVLVALAYRIAEQCFFAVFPPEVEEGTAGRVSGRAEVGVVFLTDEERHRPEELALGKLGAEPAEHYCAITILEAGALEILNNHSVFGKLFRYRVA